MLNFIVLQLKHYKNEIQKLVPPIPPMRRSIGRQKQKLSVKPSPQRKKHAVGTEKTLQL
jgi:hypothetical protein